jgi:UDP-N-acetyl-D-glucosamine dehydrogenase
LKVTVIGQGFVGLPLALEASKVGHFVVGIDANREKVISLNSGVSLISGINDFELQKLISRKKYLASQSYQSITDSEVILICVPTPVDNRNLPDLSYVIDASRKISEYISEGALVILESSVSPGTTNGLIQSILKESRKKFSLAYSPERIDPANKSYNIKNTPKLLAGIDEESTTKAKEFYETFVEKVIVASSIEVIETAKLLENSFRLVNISLVNEIAQMCKRMNIPVREVIDAAASKPFGFMPFYPSLGVGGHCIPIDPLYLAFKATELGIELKSIETARAINDRLPKYYFSLVETKLGSLRNKKILIVGITYKPNVADVRESASLKLLESLRNSGAEVNWHDELVNFWNGEKSSLIEKNYDLIILASLHDGVNIDNLPKSMILDTRGIIN